MRSKYNNRGYKLITRAAEPEPEAPEPVIFGGAGAVLKI